MARRVHALVPVGSWAREHLGSVVTTGADREADGTGSAARLTRRRSPRSTQGMTDVDENDPQILQKTKVAA